MIYDVAVLKVRHLTFFFLCTDSLLIVIIYVCYNVDLKLIINMIPSICGMAQTIQIQKNLLGHYYL